jgi:hypothetical protein
LILPSDATYEEFETYVTDLKGPKSRLELAELWEYRQKLSGIRIVNGRGYRERECPPDEHHLTLREREKKVIADARAAGIEPERASV